MIQKNTKEARRDLEGRNIMVKYRSLVALLMLIGSTVSAKSGDDILQLVDAAASAAQSWGVLCEHHQEMGVASRTFLPSRQCAGTPMALPTTSKSAICSPAPMESSKSRSAAGDPRA